MDLVDKEFRKVDRSVLLMGIDIGSTTAKVAVLDKNKRLVFSAYRRHKAEIVEVLLSILEEALQSLGNVQLDLLVTGSAGMGVSEKYNFPFIQEVVASAEVVKQLYPEVKTLIDIGGEDAKMIFFNKTGVPDIRMNGSCAGGTGAFLDEMATLLNVSVNELNDLAEQHKKIHPIASRCGVFAKTDVQNLLSREISREDIAASIFHALVYQTLATLARGYDLTPAIIFSGGPLTFLPSLKNAFKEVLEIGSEGVLEIENSELLPAIGAALAEKADRYILDLEEIIEILKSPPPQRLAPPKRLSSLFNDRIEFSEWKETQTFQRTVRVDIEQVQGKLCFLGVDSGSTTSKIVLTDQDGQLIFDYYANNKGNAIQAVQVGLTQLGELFSKVPDPPVIAKSMITGYGEDLIRTAFGFDGGMVETLAHYRGAKAFKENVSFILDIGGQDMKAIYVRDGNIQNIEINEACSSGCGSFIENFSQSMGYPVNEFADLACKAQNPCDMGSRCTVFMNSRVKQALREAATVGDISAGLAYSVIKNALHKVLKVVDTAVLGENIVVQGGTFLNPAVQKALENLIGKTVIRPDIAELMGAYGAALIAQDLHNSNGSHPSSFIGLDNLATASDYEKKLIHCGGCENRCSVTKLIFQNRNVFYTGNRCERIYTNKGDKKPNGVSLPEIKYKLLFDRPTDPIGESIQTIGIPRVLNMYENFPFWNTLLVACGFKVQLSVPSSSTLYEKGAGTVMSENICFPAKMVHGHIFDLIEAGVDRILYPMVVFEKPEFSDATNNYNCPIVSGYADVIRSAIDPKNNFGIPLDMPTVTFDDLDLLKKSCFGYLSELGIREKTIARAFELAIASQMTYRNEVRTMGNEILARAHEEDRQVVLLMGHPYHLDPYINHKTPNILAEFGVDIITEDAVPKEADPRLNNKNILTQWEYINRYIYAARWAAEENIEVVQLNSFACAPDAISIDEAKNILSAFGKGHTVIRVDEIESTGSTKLRLRSMIEALNIDQQCNGRAYTPRKEVRLFEKSDINKKILAAQFSHLNGPAIIAALVDLGYRVEPLPHPDRESVELGLKYANNEVCYPATIVVGDIIKTLQSGNHDLTDIAVGSFASGGQCRASCYTALIKRAMISAGYEDIPIIALTTNRSLHEQPGFKPSTRQFIYKLMMSLVYSDAISDMYYATACREVNRGETLALTNNYLELLQDGKIGLNKSSILGKLKESVQKFNAIQTHDRELPKVGIVGEIYVKYNSFSNNYVNNWLMEHGMEVVVPPLLEFFSMWLVGTSVQLESNLKRPSLSWLLTRFLEPYSEVFLNKAAGVLEEFRYYRPHHSIRKVADKAKKILTLNHQYGEGWLIAGEVGTLIEDGISNVLCLQPFGCIANQVVAKGVSKRLFQTYPDLNLLFLDMDHGVSEVNFFNRLHFFINRAFS
ncbi:MAG: acyl-CoA dehydratase activase [Chloroflexota bacterium]